MIREAVEQRLAACGQLLGPLQSTYWWKGRIESAAEWMCVFKTTSARAAALNQWILEVHPYEVPEIVTLEISAVSSAYGEWIENETSE